MKLTAHIGEREIQLERLPGSIFIDGVKVVIGTSGQGPIIRLAYDGKNHDLFCKRIDATTFEIWIDHAVVTVVLEDEFSRLEKLRSGGAAGKGVVRINAPMPGLVSAIEASVGERIRKGQGLFILEAMKMENEIRSPAAGTVTAIEVTNRMTVEKGQILMTITPES